MSKFQVRQQLAKGDDFLLQTFLGGLLGIGVGALILVFHAAIDGAISLAGRPSDWASWQIIAYPIIGASVTLLMFTRFPNRRQMGVRHVIQSLHQAPRHWPTTNAGLQLILTPVLLATGHSGGREGPAVHLGATLGAIVTERFRLPRNNLRTFVGAGTAAAIGGSFLTPLAGVAFAMEVVVMEYTVAGFLPVIMAAVVASTLVSTVSGEPLVPFPTFDQIQDPALGWVLLVGVACGLFSACFNYCTRWAERHRPAYSILLAGLVCGALGLLVQDSMGDGHELWRQLAGGQLTLALLAGWLAAKFIATSLVIGWGIPLGVISPLLWLGAGIGSWISLWVTGQWVPVYALIGMACAMGAGLMAPLAALIFVIELTGQIELILPAMLGLATAIIIHRMAHQGALFVDQLADNGFQLQLHRSNHPMHHLGAEAALQKDFVQVPRRFSGLPRKADWVVWREGPKTLGALPWLEFVRATQALAEGEALTQLEAVQLGRVKRDATLAEVVSQCQQNKWHGAYVLSHRAVRGLLIEQTLREQFQ